jgi:ketosteroid isomerase-like protein
MRPSCAFVAFLVGLALAPVALRAQSASAQGRADIESFNRALSDATRRMDNAATMALWSEDGVSLLPSTKPIEGKAAIGAFLSATTAGFPGAHMEQFELRCQDVEVSGDWASEWCTEHQVVRFADARPPFDGWGKLLLVLHRSSDGQWRIRTEMWNQAVPDGKASSHGTGG